MFRLIQITPEDVDVLFELVCLSPETEAKPTLLAGLTEMAQHFRSTGDPSVRMVFTADFHRELYDIVMQPFMPADATRHGVPTERYLYMCTRLPQIQKSVATPELWDPTFAGMQQEPKKTYLN